MDDATRQILFGAACPATITGALLGAGLVATRRPENRRRWPWLAPLAVGIPVTLAFLALYGWPGPTETWRTAAFAPMLGLAATALVLLLPHPWTRHLAVFALAGALTSLIRPYTRPEHWAIQLLPAPALLILVGFMNSLASRGRGPSIAIGLALSTGAAAALVLVSGFLKLSVPIGALATSTALLAAYSLARRDLSLARGVMFIVLPTMWTALLIAYLEVKFRKDPIPPVAFALVAFAPLAMWLAELPWLRSRRPWLAGAVGIVAVSLLAGSGIVLALTAAKPVKKDPYADLYKDMLSK